MAHILITGGAGYIGSHACKAVKNAGHIPVTYDNISTGWRDAVKFGPLEVGELSDAERLRKVFNNYPIESVIHFAALSDVGQSTKEPALYWQNNFVGSKALLDVMLENDVHKIVFSSTCATYGEHDGVTLDESCPQFPINAYGASKRAVEDLLKNYDDCYGLKHVAFRYFNVAGADPESEIGEHHRPETHLVPLALDTVIGKRDALTVYGTDYDTPDGTCIRDYVHVTDLVDAHLLGLDWLNDGKESAIFNLGTGHGFSVHEVINATKRLTNKPLTTILGERRDGDCTKLVSGSEKAAKLLNWKPKRSTMDRMIKDAWSWHQIGHYDN